MKRDISCNVVVDRGDDCVKKKKDIISLRVSDDRDEYRLFKNMSKQKNRETKAVSTYLEEATYIF